jgi:hypothetical protein
VSGDTDFVDNNIDAPADEHSSEANTLNTNDAETGREPANGGDPESTLPTATTSTGRHAAMSTLSDGSNQHFPTVRHSKTLTGASTIVMAALSPHPGAGGAIPIGSNPQNLVVGSAILGRDQAVHPTSSADVGKATPDRPRKSSVASLAVSGAESNIKAATPQGTSQIPPYGAAVPQTGLTQPLTEGTLQEAPVSEPEFFPQIGTNMASAARVSALHPMQAQAARVAQQIASATIQSQAGTTEIALNPEELGRVRIALTTSEAGISVSILADRPETAELMRRNLEDLAREFRELGYDSVTFTFGDQSDGSDSRSDDQAIDGAVEHDSADGPSTPSITTVALRGGLDLKL